MVQTGLQMMLKSMGIDTDGVMQQFKEPIENMIQLVQQVNEKLSIINDRLVRIEITMNTLPIEEAERMLENGRNTSSDSGNSVN